MRDLVPQLRALCDSDRRFALATVTSTAGSTPRPVGTVMAVAADGEVVGSLSGGCVEAAVYDLAQLVLSERRPQQASYGITDDDAFAIGLTCGGTLQVLVAEPDREVLDELLRRLVLDEPCTLATVVSGPAAVGAQLLVTALEAVGSLGNGGLDVAATADGRGVLAAGQNGLRHYGAHGERRLDDVTVLLQSFTPPPRMLVFGATDFAGALTRMGSFLGYRVVLCDARPVFATTRRFPAADEVVCDWPDRYLAAEVAAGRVDVRTVIAVVTHDPKFDVPLLAVALASPAGYVGAMGSRRTHDKRMTELRAAGVDELALGRLRSPIGLDIGGRTAEETAVSIAAELVQARWGGSGLPLRSADGAIHWSVTDGIALAP
ncbi:MAG: xanthine dehydrogenase accessory factor [Actinomycetota bacterium]|jgi:xanthine dehydrogenase accessory factor|nr:xanthine dehydrogenase accessory factor [Actinomycetota bacterium]